MSEGKDMPTFEDVENAVMQVVNQESVSKSSQAAAFEVEHMSRYNEEMRVPNSQDAWLEVYTQHVWAYAGIYAIASTIAMLAANHLTLNRRKRGGEDIEIINDHPSLKLLKNPNTTETGYDLFEGLTVCLEASGAGYFEVVYDTTTTQVDGKTIGETQEPSELWLVRPDRLTPVPAKDGRTVKKWIYQLKRYAKKAEFAAKQIIQFKYFNPLSVWTGLGSLAPAMDDLRQDKQMARWNLDFFLHGVTPEGILTTEQLMPPWEMEDLGKQIKEFLSGKGRKILLLSKGLQWQQVSIAPKDIEFLAGRKENRQSILAALGVPPVKVGLLEHAKYDNYALQLEAFHGDTILPKLRKIGGVLNTQYLPKWPDLANQDDEWEYFFGFDTSSLLKEDADKVVDRLVVQVINGLMTPNEARVVLNLPPWPAGTGGDQFYQPANVRMAGAVVEDGSDMNDPVVKRLDSMEATTVQQLRVIESKLRKELMEAVHETRDETS